MLKKTLLLCLLFLSKGTLYASSNDLVDFDMNVGLGIHFGYGHGYDAYLEYKYSEDTSLYVIANQLNALSSSYSQNSDKEDIPTGNATMLGIQSRFFKHIILGYHKITKTNTHENVLTEATSAVSGGLVLNIKGVELGAIIYYLNDKTKTKKQSISAGMLIRKSFSFN
jgi:hypothetical protein